MNTARFIHSPRQRGSAFILTLWITAALTGLTLVLAHSVRVESLAAANRLALAQANAAAKGAEQYAVSLVDQEVATPGSTNGLLSEDPLDIGGAYVWIIKPDPDDETAIAYGLTDEAGKLDINKAGSADGLTKLPNITQENVDCLVDWRDQDSNQGSQGAEDPYYASLPHPYHCKNAPFETVEELLLVKSFDTDVLFGGDMTRSGHVDKTDNMMSTNLAFGTSTSARGLFPFITVYGVKASTTPGSQQINNTQTADLNANNTAQLGGVLRRQNFPGDVNNVLSLTAQNRPYISTWDWAVKVKLTPEQFATVFNYVRIGGAATTGIARVNVNSAPRQVLMCVPGLTEADADAIIAHVQANPNPQDPSDITWLLNTVPSKNSLSFAGPLLTGVSYCFSADILACSADGRAFKRTRVVIDASVSPSRIIYRRDMSQSGWPLDPSLRENIRTGKYVSSSSLMMPRIGGNR